MFLEFHFSDFGLIFRVEKRKQNFREGEGKTIRDDGYGEEDSLSTQGEVAPTDLHYLVRAITG